MSGQVAIVPVNVLERKDLTPSDKLVFVALASFANRERRCFPGTRSIVRRTGLSARSIFRSVKNLEQVGLIAVERRFDPDRREYAVNRYSLQHDDIPGGSDNLSVGSDTVSVGSDKKYPRVVSQCHNNSTKEQYQEQECENPEVSPSKEVLPKPSLKTEPTDKDQEPLDGRQSPEDFERTCRKFFKEFVEAYPKPGAGSKKAYAIFKAFFSPEEQHFERNADRFQNIMGATTAYGRIVDPEAPRFTRSAERFLSELDADLPVEEEVTLLVRKTS